MGEKETMPNEEMDKFMDDVMSAVQTHFIGGQDILTKERAIDYLRKCGWLERHDKEIYEEGIIKGVEQQYDEDEYKRGYEDGRKSNEVTLTTDGTITAPSQSVLGVAAAAIADDKMGYKHGYEDGLKAGRCEINADDWKYNADDINRENIAKAFQFGLAFGFGEKYDEMDRMIDEIKKVITTQSKTGHWIPVEELTDWYGATYECSCCSRQITIPYDLSKDLYLNYPYCHCGAKMIKPQKSEG